MAKKQIHDTSEEDYIREDISEIGEEGLAHFRGILKFGDIIENGWASERNPTKLGIVVKAREHSINCTDGLGKFWDLVFDAGTKIKLHGNVLNDNYKKLITSKK